jgi:hypothetical protein
MRIVIEGIVAGKTFLRIEEKANMCAFAYPSMKTPSVQE